MHERLATPALRPETPVDSLTFASTDDLQALPGGMGQERARRALEFGIGMRAEGYNVFALGSAGTDRRLLVDDILASDAQHREPPADWCYAHNFKAPDRPRTLELAAGDGQRLRDALGQFVEDLRAVIPAAFQDEEFRRRLNEINQEFNERQQRELEPLQEEAQQEGLSLMQTPQGFAFAPVRDGKAIDNETFQGLPEAERDRLSEAIQRLNNKLMERMQQMPQRQQEHLRAQRNLAREFTRTAIQQLMTDLRQSFAAYDSVLEQLTAIEHHVVDHAQTILALESESGQQQQQQRDLPSAESFYARYKVNPLVDHAAQQGAPIVFVSNPTLDNLVGRLEHRPELGTLVTDFTLIKPGALHQANGGYLVIEAERLLTKPFAWDALKRALFDDEIKIEAAGDFLSLGRTFTLEPEPVALDVKVVLLGERMTYYLLAQYDLDFPRLFKVPADFNDRIERTPSNVELYARMIATQVQRAELHPFDAGAVAAVIDCGARMVGDPEKLSAHTMRVLDLLREAEHFARRDDASLVRATHVREAVEQQVERLGRVRDDVYEQITRDTVHVDTEGTAVGQVNGLSVLQLGDFAFGQPNRITATARLGTGRVVDIEREAELGGKLHSKAVMILAAFVGQRFAGERPLSLAASLVFEQSYGGIEGDSATLAETTALLSALAAVPIRQYLAITGSMDQYGRAQAIGGANEKIEGHYDVCASRGLTGHQGVILPATNVKHLMLRPDVVEAVGSQRFHIHAVETIDDALELLTGLDAGTPDSEGRFSAESFNGRVQARLDELTRISRRFTQQASTAAESAGSEEPSP